METQILNKTEKTKNSAEEIDKPFAPYEEIQEKKTTKLGYILLIIMVIIGLWQGQGFISSLASNIPKPQDISYCGNYLKGLIASNGNIKSNYSNYRNSYYGGIDNLPNCTYSEIENKYSLKNIVGEIMPLQSKVSVLQMELQNLDSQFYQVQNSINQQKQDYIIALQEKIAKEDGTVYDKSGVKSGLSQAELQSSNIKEQEIKIQSELDGINKSILEIVATIVDY